MSLWADRLAEIWAPPRAAGSGVAVGTHGVLTARHVIAGAAAAGEPPLARVVRPGEAVGPWVPMRVAWEREGWDLALLTVDGEAGEWLTPRSAAPPVADPGHATVPGCEATGFPQAEVVEAPGGPDVRQSEQIVGTLLPAGQGKPPVRPDRPLVAGRWMPLDVATATPGAQDRWGGMSGAAVLLPGGGLAGIVIAAEQGHQQRRLYVLPLATAVAEADGFADALAACTGTPAVARARTAATWERLLAPAALGADRLPVAIGAGELGAFGVKAGDVAGEPPYLRYVPRDEDETLRAALRDAVAERQMLLVVGGSASGKSRSAAEAVRALLGDHRLVRPQAGRLAELAEAPVGELAPAVVWLDDVQTFAHDAFAATLQRLLAAGLPVVGTIRRAELAVLDAPGDLRDPTGETLADPRLVRRVNWRTAWSSDELGRLRELVSSEELLAAAAEGTPPGAYCVAGPALVRRLRRARDDEDHPARYWLVRAVLDWHRTGTRRPMPLAEAQRIAGLRAFPHGGADPARLQAALDEALRPEFSVPPSSPPPALLARDHEDGLRAHDYVLDDDQRSGPADIPDAVWESAIGHGSHDDLAGITMGAFAAGRRDQAAAAARPLADAGYTGSMFNLGIVAWHEDDHETARAWWERAAEGGMPSAMVNLGMLVRDEDPAAARTWYERAAAAGNDTAMTNLGALLRDTDPAAARSWFGRAAELGNPNAMVGLGALDVDAAPDVARDWFRRAAEAGAPAGMHNLALLLTDDDPAASRAWYERAAAAGHPDAMARLGVLTAREGDVAGARAWLAQAAEAGHRDAMFNLGVLFEDEDPAASRAWFERAAADGDPDARARLH